MTERSSAYFKMPQAIALYEDSDRDAENSLADYAIETLAPNIVSLQQDWLAEIQTLSYVYRDDTYRISISADSVQPDPTKPGYWLPYPSGHDPNDPGGHNGSGPCMATVAASDNEAKTVAQNQSSLETKNMNNLVETIKSGASALGSTLNNIFDLAQSFLETLNQGKSCARGVK